MVLHGVGLHLSEAELRAGEATAELVGQSVFELRDCHARVNCQRDFGTALHSQRDGNLAREESDPVALCTKLVAKGVEALVFIVFVVGFHH